MTFDLIAWPVDRALSFEEAVREADALSGSFGLGRRRDPRIERFITQLAKRHPGIRSRLFGPPFEIEVAARHVFIGIPWSEVEAVTRDVGDAAWATGLALYDPQRGVVALPAPFAEAPMAWDGLDGHVRAAAEALSTIIDTVQAAGPGDSRGLRRAVSANLAAAGYRQMSPLGFEITPDMVDEIDADPTRVPTSLQTPERRDALIRDLDAPASPTRHTALAQLAGWDPDAEVMVALRPLLASEDTFIVSTAAAGLARQLDVKSLGPVLDVVRSLSPSGGGSVSAMLVPLRAALTLARLAGPEVDEWVRARAREWIGPALERPKAWERDVMAEAVRLLDEGSTAG